MNEKNKQPTLEELCKYFWELAKKYALTEQGKKEIASVEFCLKSEMIMNKVGTIEESEKALNIICRKEVGFSQLYYSNNVEDYNNTLYFRFKPSAYESMALTQAEFNLVKKVVEKYGSY